MSTRHMVTMKEVAEAAGVSKAAVSAALGGNYKTVQVSDSTRARIVDIADRMNYRLNINARALRRQSTGIIGYCGILQVRTSFFAEMISGLQAGCERHHKDLLLHGGFLGRSASEILSELSNGRVDGLVMYTTPDHPLVSLLADSHLPAVAVVDALPGIPSVVVDDTQGMRLLVHHLADKGHRHLLFKHNSDALLSALRRRTAFQEAVEECGLRASYWEADDFVDMELVKTGLRWDAPQRDRPTAVVCWHDAAAYHLLAHCDRLGLQIPGDIAICGFDNLPPPIGILRRLTTVEAPWGKVTETAIGLMTDRLNGAELPLETALPVDIVPGDTT